jgi:hypothetical protein
MFGQLAQRERDLVNTAKVPQGLLLLANAAARLPAIADIPAATLSRNTLPAQRGGQGVGQPARPAGLPAPTVSPGPPNVPAAPIG